MKTIIDGEIKYLNKKRSNAIDKTNEVCREIIKKMREEADRRKKEDEAIKDIVIEVGKKYKTLFLSGQKVQRRTVKRIYKNDQGDIKIESVTKVYGVIDSINSIKWHSPKEFKLAVWRASNKPKEYKKI